ncbi:MAG: serine/threonine-protein kinase [Planctomycetaceae bacterium]
MTDDVTIDAIPDEHSAEPLGLPRHGVDRTAAARETVEVLATQFIEEHRCGLSPSIDHYARRFPAQAADIRRLFPLVAAMEEWKSDKATAAKEVLVLSPIQVDRFGDCRIIREVGRGGMGVVFEAFQDPPGRRVAVKILPWQHSPDSPWREQFAHEARLAARLRHANIVPVYQYGEQPGFSYYVMPFIVGVGLDWIIQRLAQDEGIVSADEIRRAHASSRNGDGVTQAHGPVGSASIGSGGNRTPIAPNDTATASGRQLTRRAWKKIAKIGVQAAAALRYAHQKGLLHRDIKPGNVLLDTDGVVWITDFGLARQISGVDETPGIAGTLRYMSPEHLVGSADERSDVYALGVTLHELCTLKPAFEAKTRAGLKQAIRRGEIIIPHEIEPLVPPPLEAVILKAAAADPEQRYQSADELKSDLLRFLNGRRVTATSRRVTTTSRQKRRPRRK